MDHFKEYIHRDVQTIIADKKAPTCSRILKSLRRSIAMALTLVPVDQPQPKPKQPKKAKADKKPSASQEDPRQPKIT